MVIRSSSKIHCLSFLLAIFFISAVASLNWSASLPSNTGGRSDEISPRTSNVVIDKVYEFTTSNPLKSFSNIEFTSQYLYYFYFRMVTPHECELQIRITDPEESTFNVFYDDSFSQEEGLHQFPFGVAINGPHDIHFEVATTYNINIYIKIERTVKCLHDIIPSQDLSNIRMYGVRKFETFSSELKEIELDSDTDYEIYITRVSPISIAIVDNQVNFNYSIEDKERNVKFVFNWKNLPLMPIGEVTRFSFGTSNGGPYEMNLSVYYEFNPVNIAYAILYDHDISEEIDGNQTDSIINERDFSNFLVNIPIEHAALFIGGIGIMALVAFGLVTKNRRKKKNNFGIFKP
ncbi:MAG: hypothetical protein ACFFAS_14865 [Promethearchaeota archaeon]